MGGIESAKTVEGVSIYMRNIVNEWTNQVIDVIYPLQAFRTNQNFHSGSITIDKMTINNVGAASQNFVDIYNI